MEKDKDQSQSQETSQESGDDPGSKIANISLVGGPFHFSLRAGSYGGPWDEIPWRVAVGLEEIKPRLGYEDNPSICRYSPKVLLNNWVDERSDRCYIKYDGPRISQYGHHYVTESSKAFKRSMCNKPRDALLKIASFPQTYYPGHQPELNTDVMECSAATPETWIEDQEIANCEKEMERKKRYYRASLL